MPVALFSAATFATATDRVFLPWQRAAAACAWQQSEPTLVVVPFRSDAAWLKTRLLEAGLHGLGVRFVTPPELRDELRRRFKVREKIALREHLELLLALAAETLLAAAQAPAPTLAAARAVAGAPDHLLHAIDQLKAGGWSFSQAGPEPLRPIVEVFEGLLERCEFALLQDADRELERRARAAKTPLFAAIHLAGFSGLHWPVWPLLCASVRAARHATVSLLDPRPEAEELDSAWIGTWEQTFGPCAPIPAADPEPGSFADVLRLPESAAQTLRRQKEPAGGIEFLAGENTREEARAIVTKALGFLSEKNCTRLGILLPAGGALARTVAALLSEAAVPHNDGLAHFAPGPLEEPAWPAWLALQDNPCIDLLLGFLRIHPAENLFEGLHFSQIEAALRDALQSVLIDDLRLLIEVLDAHAAGKTARRIARGLRAFPFLPKTAALPEFIAQSLAVFDLLQWEARSGELRRLSADWAARLAGVPLSRRAFVRWLGQVLVSMRAERDPAGNHPFSRVQLLPYAQAETQPWSHLILAGLNEGGWPQPFDQSGYIGEEEIEALNQRLRVLNQSVVIQGRQGEGHWTVLPGKALCLGPVQKRDLTLRQFLNTLESVSVAIAATASLSEESQPGRRLYPSDLFTRLFFCARGKSVSQATMSALREETHFFLHNAAALFTAPAALSPAAAPAKTAPRPQPAPIERTRLAFDSRRDASRPFGEFEFSLREKLSRPLSLSATDWEKALQSPALLFLRRLLGVQPPPQPVPAATGQWVHRWLASIPAHAAHALPPGVFVPLPEPQEIVRRTRAEAEAFRAAVSGWLAKTGNPEPPDWWVSGWRQAVAIAETLAGQLASAEGAAWMACEWSLPRQAVDIAPGKTLRFHGRIDLILGGEAPLQTTGLPALPWVVDFKTGNKKSLSPPGKSPGERGAQLAKKFGAGEGLQLALYALALRQLGAQNLGLSVLSPELALDLPQLALEDINAQQALWLGLYRIQETGVLGMLGPLRNEHAFTPAYPLATLGIDPAVLAKKWRRTHPEFDGAAEPPKDE